MADRPIVSTISSFSISGSFADYYHVLDVVDVEFVGVVVALPAICGGMTLNPRPANIR